jgi:hypothetical protein
VLGAGSGSRISGHRRQISRAKGSDIPARHPVLSPQTTRLGGVTPEWTNTQGAALYLAGKAMITEAKLLVALDKIDHRLSRKTHGRPMSGLSIPADYYFARKNRTIAALARSKKPARVIAGK